MPKFKALQHQFAHNCYYLRSIWVEENSTVGHRVLSYDERHGFVVKTEEILTVYD